MRMGEKGALKAREDQGGVRSATDARSICSAMAVQKLHGLASTTDERRDLALIKAPVPLARP